MPYLFVRLLVCFHLLFKGCLVTFKRSHNDFNNTAILKRPDQYMKLSYWTERLYHYRNKHKQAKYQWTARPIRTHTVPNWAGHGSRLNELRLSKGASACSMMNMRQACLLLFSGGLNHPISFLSTWSEQSEWISKFKVGKPENTVGISGNINRLTEFQGELKLTVSLLLTLPCQAVQDSLGPRQMSGMSYWPPTSVSTFALSNTFPLSKRKTEQLSHSSYGDLLANNFLPPKFIICPIFNIPPASKFKFKMCVFLAPESMFLRESQSGFYLCLHQCN